MSRASLQQYRTRLSWFQRLLFGMALPILAYYGTYVLLEEHVNVLLQPFALPAARAAARGDAAQIFGAYAPLLALVMSLPLWMFTLGCMLRPWRHWSTAFAGGMIVVAVSVAVSLGALVLITRLLG